MIPQALLVVFCIAESLAVMTTGRHYKRQKESRALATRTNLIEMKRPRCGTMPMECLLQCNQLPACPALNAFNNGTCELLLSPVLAVHFLAESTAYIHRFEPADTTDLMPATTSMPAVPPVTSQPTEAAPTDKTCPGGFGDMLVTSAAHGSCYQFVRIGMTWQDARAHCVSLGGDLVANEDEAELKHIGSVASDNSLLNKDFWSSGTDEDVEGEWRWASTGAQVSFSLPGIHSKDNGNTLNCLRIRYWYTTYSGWLDSDCKERYYPLCEIALG